MPGHKIMRVGDYRADEHHFEVANDAAFQQVVEFYPGLFIAPGKAHDHRIICFVLFFVDGYGIFKRMCNGFVQIDFFARAQCGYCRFAMGRRGRGDDDQIYVVVRDQGYWIAVECW